MAPVAVRSGSEAPADAPTRSAHREGSVAWADVRAVIETGEPEGFPVRLSLVLLDSGDGWRIVQSHASGP